jgi:hypothetical protein
MLRSTGALASARPRGISNASTFRMSMPRTFVWIVQLPEQLTGLSLVVVGQGPSFEVLVGGGGLAGSSLAITEAMALIESIGDPTLTVGLSFAAIYANSQNAEVHDVLRWSQRVIDLADGDPSKGNFIVGSPLAVAFTTRGTARYALGRPGWRDDLRHGLAMARRADPMSYSMAVYGCYSAAIRLGSLAADDSAVREIEDALRIVERSGDDLALSNAQESLGVALVHREADADRDRGQKLLAEVSDVFLRGHDLSDLPIVNAYLARERARRGDRDDAVPLIRAATDHLFREGQLLAWSIPATGVLVDTLLDHGSESDVAEAEAAITRLAAAPADDGLVMRDVWLLRMRASLARAHGDEASYRENRDRYRAMATSLRFEGHMKLRHIAPLAIAASAAAIGLAPIASADANVQQSPGNAQVTATPGEAAQQAAQNQMPFGGDSSALLFHRHGVATAP